MMTRFTALALLATFSLQGPLALATVASAQDAPPVLATRDDPALGSILTDVSGWTLYSFANDGPETSTCSGACAATWPPLTVDADSITQSDLPGAITVFQREDGTMQAAYDLAPLYYYSRDAQPGDTNGQGVGGLWFAAPSGLTPVAPASPPSPAPTVPAPTPTAAPTRVAVRPTPPVNTPGSSGPTSSPSAPAAPTAAPAPTQAPSAPRPMY